MVICEGGGEDGSYGYEMSFNGLMVFDVTTGEGFNELGGISHGEPATGDDYWSVCGNWWTNPNSTVKRSVFMEDYVYSIALEKINIAHIDSLDTPLASVELIFE